MGGFRLVSLSAVKPYFMGFLALFIFRLLLSESVFFSKIGVKIGVVGKCMSIPLLSDKIYATGNPTDFRFHSHFSLSVIFNAQCSAKRTPRATVPNRAAGRLGERTVPILFMIRETFHAVKYILRLIVYIFIGLEVHYFPDITI